MSESATAHITKESTFDHAIEGWKMYLEDQGKSPHTVKAFSADLNLLASYLPDGQVIGGVTTEKINEFLDWLQDGRGVPCSPKTLARRITSIKAFFRWLVAGGAILADPAEKVVQRSVISPLPTVLAPEEVEAAKQAADRLRSGDSPDHRYYTLLTLLLQTGLKKSETLALAPEHVDLEAPNGPTLFVRYNSPQHRYKERKIALDSDWVEAYSHYASAYSLEDRLFPWSPRRLEYLLEDIGNEAGLEKHISFAMCRWTSALMDMRAGVDPNKVRQKLGISKIQWREVSMKLRKLDKITPE